MSGISPIYFALLFAVLVFSIFGSYLYRSVLPFEFTNQWEATENALNSTGEYDKNNETGEFLGHVVKSKDLTSDETFLADNPSNQVLGDSESDDKRIEVDLSKQMVYAYEGDDKVMEFLISSGKWGRTPTGEFNIAYKTKSQTMSGGSKALRTYYYLPNVQYVQFFGNSEIPWSKGFSFHGTYWHDKFGTPQSHGCINMRNEDAKQLFEWTNPSMGDKRTVKAPKDEPGTKVFIYGEPPKG